MVSHTHGGTIPLAAADSLSREESLRRFCDTYDHLQPGIGRNLADTISDITDDVEKLIRCHLDRGVSHTPSVNIHFMARCAICAPSEPHVSWASPETAPTEEEDEDNDEVRSVHSSDGQEDNSKEKAMSAEATNESGKRRKVQ